MNDVSEILEAIKTDESLTGSQLVPALYQNLRELAASKMAREAPGHTLSPTALVHEAWLRIKGNGTASTWDSKGHFFMAAAEAMRRILIDSARKKNTEKRGCGEKPLDLFDMDTPIYETDDRFLELDAALEKLEATKPQLAQLVKLRFYVGLTYEEIGPILNLTERTASRKFAYARVWLREEIEGKE
ncbi:MAG: ECF-type sigma factor [Verrucomicrobiota bacterium]